MQPLTNWQTAHELYKRCIGGPVLGCAPVLTETAMPRTACAAAQKSRCGSLVCMLKHKDVNDLASAGPNRCKAARSSGAPHISRSVRRPAILRSVAAAASMLMK
jgi:hypothetical protein